MFLIILCTKRLNIVTVYDYIMTDMCVTQNNNNLPFDDVSNVQFINTLDYNYLYNYAKLKIINLLSIQMDVENNSTLFVNTLHLLNFVRDQDVRKKLTTEFLNKCTINGKLKTNMSSVAPQCILMVGVIDDHWTQAAVKSVMMTIEDSNEVTPTNA